jgi:adenylosuccinate synthase
LPSRVVILSGRVASGKSTLAKQLEELFSARVIKTKDLNVQLEANAKQERSSLQKHGEALDRKTDGAWVCDALVPLSQGLPAGAVFVVDSARIKPQIDKIRQAFGARVVHVHLEAPKEVLSERYKRKQGHDVQELQSYDAVGRDPVESKVDQLSAVADVVIDTHRCNESDVLVRVASHLGLYGREPQRLVDVLVGGQFGSEGKGHIASYLAPEYEVLVRVGGPNAGHTVFETPKPHKLHLLPSGTPRNEDAQIVIGPGAVIEVDLLLKEIARFKVEVSRLTLDPNVMIIEKADCAAEQKLKESIGSTGQGVGAATARRITERGKDSVRLAKDIKELRPFVFSAAERLEKAYTAGKKVLLEGTQGTGLSLYHGHYPFVTSRDTTVAGCLAEAGIAPSRVRKVVVVCRTYPIRVESPAYGDSGPMAQEISWEEISNRSKIPLEELQQTEKTTTTGRRRRVAEFDWTLLWKAVVLNCPSDVALTFVDYLTITNRDARRFEQLQESTIRFINEVEHVAGAPVSLISTRFDYRSIIDRRKW